MNKIAQIYSSLFFVGYIKPASGTFGTFFSILIIFPLVKHLSLLSLIIIFFILFIAAIKFISLHSKNENSHDSSEIVIDEFLGVFFIMLFYEYFNFLNDLYMSIVIFFLFRIFDIVKPFPARWIDEKMISSFGVILDDIIAGVYCVITLILINAFF
jgi:phosphatidylglycerophosphatase A|tara:strand:- start:4 stop:471 length:468 start_codon:yes stop_codon:yes gene_type:complete